MGEQRFISLRLLLLYLKRGSYQKKFKEKYDRLLQGIKENFPQFNETSAAPDIALDSDTCPESDIIPNLATIATPTQIKLPNVEKTYSYLYIAKGLDTESPPPRIREIHFGITADGLKERIKDIEKGNYYVGELVATIVFEGTQTRSDGSIIASEDCADLEKWFKTNPAWH